MRPRCSPPLAPSAGRYGECTHIRSLIPNRKANGSAMQALIKCIRLERRISMRTSKDAKTMAKSLRESLTARNVLLSHSECLEIVARLTGFANWNTLSAKLDVDSGQLARPGACQITSTDHEQMSCSFCGKSGAGLFEGGCSCPPRADQTCVFIGVECVEFCAEVIADRAKEAVAAPQARESPATQSS